MKSAAIALIPIFFTMPLFATEAKEDVFWKWFEKNQDTLFNFEKDRERTFDRLGAAMSKVHQDLTFEFGPIRNDGTREFIISAAGIKTAFPAVESLFAAAPVMPKWKILKYRQRRLPIHDLEFGATKVKSSEVHYAIFKDSAPDKVGVMLFMEGYTEKDGNSEWRQIGYLFLDEALGEFDVETHVGAIAFFDCKSQYFEHARPLAELPSHFDELLGRPTTNVLKEADKVTKPGS